MEKAPENGKGSSHSAHSNEINEWMNEPFLYSHMLVTYATDHDMDIFVSLAALGSPSAIMSVMIVWGSQKCVCVCVCANLANLLVGDYADRCWDFQNYRLLQQWEILSFVTVLSAYFVTVLNKNKDIWIKIYPCATWCSMCGAFLILSF